MIRAASSAVASGTEPDVETDIRLHAHRFGSQARAGLDGSRLLHLGGFYGLRSELAVRPCDRGVRLESMPILQTAFTTAADVPIFTPVRPAVIGIILNYIVEFSEWLMAPCKGRLSPTVRQPRVYFTPNARINVAAEGIDANNGSTVSG
jgi:hypothetical protein